MIKQINTSYLKKKFGTLISKSYTDAKIDLDSINEKLIYSDFLDSFEQNNIDDFINKSSELIIQELFNKEIVFKEETNTVLYWCGIQYMNIFLNKQIPLKQILLLCPIKKMSEYFDIYHELNERDFIYHFMNSEYKESILKNIRKKYDYTIPQLSHLTSISENTLKYYELGNKNLFNSSNENIQSIIAVTSNNIDSLFIEKSNFVAYTANLLKDESIYSYFKEYIKKYYKSNYDIINEDNIWYFEVKNKKHFIEDIVIKKAIQYAIDSYKDSQLLF